MVVCSVLSAFRFGFRDGLQIRQGFLEHPAVHEQADGLEHEVVLSDHAPRHGLIAFGLQGELRDDRGFEGLEEFEVEPDELLPPGLIRTGA